MALYREILDSETSQSINIALFKNVKNVPDLRCKVRAGSLKCCLIKPSLVIDPMQVAVAANKAALKEKLSSMVTKSVFTEILFNLSISRKITDSLNRFSVANTDTNVLAVVLEKVGESNVDSILSAINGEQVDIENLSDYSDVKLIEETYNVKEKERDVSTLAESVISRVAAKDILLLQD